MFENNEDFDFNDDDLDSCFNINNEKIDEIINKSKEKNKDLISENLDKKGIDSDVTKNVANFNNYKVLKRTFPGPAGLLPDRKKSSRIIEENLDKNLDDNDSNVILCSQAPQNKFNEEPWVKMLKDFENYEFLLDKYTIHWIKNQARLKKLYNQKSPILVGIIQSLEVTGAKIPTINITLKDKSGDIQGSILNNLYEEYVDYLTVGSVLVLKQFGVLTTGDNNNYLTITSNNLLTIYSVQTPLSLDDVNKNFSGVKKIVVNNLDFDEIQRNIKESSEKILTKTPSFNVGNTIKKPNLSKLRNNSFTSVNKAIETPKAQNQKTEKSIFDDNCDTDSLFNDDFNIPDNFEEVALSQMSTKSNISQQDIHKKNEKCDIIKNIFEGVDTDTLFDDF